MFWTLTEDWVDGESSSLQFSVIVVLLLKRKFMCLMHSEAKQYQTLEFGVEKGLVLLQGHARRWWFMP